MPEQPNQNVKPKPISEGELHSLACDAFKEWKEAGNETHSYEKMMAFLEGFKIGYRKHQG